VFSFKNSKKKEKGTWAAYRNPSATTEKEKKKKRGKGRTGVGNSRKKGKKEGRLFNSWRKNGEGGKEKEKKEGGSPPES